MQKSLDAISDTGRQKLEMNISKNRLEDERSNIVPDRINAKHIN
jgi:hypothetical protein